MSATPAQRILLLGGSSEIGLAIVRALAARRPARVVLAGRDPARLQRAADELSDGCQEVQTASVEATRTADHRDAVSGAFDLLGGIDVAIVAIGVLGEPGVESDDVPAAVRTLEVNVVGAGSLLLETLRRLRAQGGGTAVVLSSVAAERPRAANPVYGASKAGLDAIAQGMADALHAGGVRVLVVRPGFVHTRMTRGRRPAPLATDADAVARATLRGLDRGSHTVWAPPILRVVMAAIRHLPRRLFRRLAL